MTTNIYRDVSPTAVLRVLDTDLKAPTDASQGPEEERRLRDSVRWASSFQEGFLVEVATAAKLLRDWCKELETWQWNGTFEQQNMTTEHPPDEVYSGEDTGSTLDGRPEPGERAMPALFALSSDEAVRRSQQRVASIKQELRDINIEQHKAAVLETHHRFEVSPRSKATSRAEEHTQLNDIDALTTALVLNSLPYHARLLSLLDIWSARLLVLSLKTDYLSDLRGLRLDLTDAWSNLNRKTLPSSRGSGQQAAEVDDEDVEAMQRLLEERHESLGEQLDAMLDALEGREDTLPSHWIEETERLEAEIATWVKSAGEKANESRQASTVQQESIDAEPNLEEQSSSPPAYDAPGSPAMPIVAPHQEELVSKSDQIHTDPRMQQNFVNSITDLSAFEAVANTPDDHAYRATTLNAFVVPNLLTSAPGESQNGERDPRERSKSPPQSSDGNDSISSFSMSPRVSQAFLQPFSPIHATSTAGRLDRTLHRRKSSHEVTIRDASLASTYSMSQVKKIDIVKGVSTPTRTHRRQRSGSMPTLPILPLAHTVDDIPDRDQVSDRRTFQSPRRSDFVLQSDTTIRSRSSIQHFPQPDDSGPGPAYTAVSDDSEPRTAQTTGKEQEADATQTENATSGWVSSDLPSSITETEESPHTQPRLYTGFEQDSMPTSHEQTAPTTPVQLSRSQMPFTSTDEQLERRIDKIIHSLPTRINFDRKSRYTSSRLSYGSQIPQSPSTPPTKPSPNGSSPTLTLAQADLITNKSLKSKPGDTTIRLYHLMQNGKPPIRLFVRLIGDSGRVMVRVGGGWADLAQYLREYATHHSRAIVPDGEQALQDVKRDSPSDKRAFSLPSYVGQQQRPASSMGPRTPSRLGAVPRQEGVLHVQKNVRAMEGGTAARSSSQLDPPTLRLIDNALSSEPVREKVEPPNFDSRNQEDEEDDDGPRSKLTAEKKKWLDDMVARAKRWKAEGGSGSPKATGASQEWADAGMVSNAPGGVKRVYRTSDGTLKEFGT